jgi:hypothetical protein
MSVLNRTGILTPIDVLGGGIGNSMLFMPVSLVINLSTATNDLIFS